MGDPRDAARLQVARILHTAECSCTDSDGTDDAYYLHLADAILDALGVTVEAVDHYRNIDEMLDAAASPATTQVVIRLPAQPTVGEVT